MPQVSFTLTVSITGTSLGEIDDGLVQAAGERLKARMNTAPAANFTPPAAAPHAPVPAPMVATTERHEAPEFKTVDKELSDMSEPPAAAAEHAPKKRGRKPGVKVGKYNKTKVEGVADEQEDDAGGEEADFEGADAPEGSSAGETSEPEAGAENGQPGGHVGHGDVGAAPKSGTAAPVNESTGARIPTIDEVVTALKSVNAAKNVDTARDILASFSVKRCTELADDQRRAFIDKCAEVCAS